MLMEIRHLLTSTDCSERAKRVVTSAFELAQTFGAKVSRLHAIEVPVYAIEVALPLEDLEWDARHALPRLLPEAKAERVVRLAPCPVLTIRPPGDRSAGLRTTLI
jgi:nucleotide-binding universal stress UspA family protein